VLVLQKAFAEHERSQSMSDLIANENERPWGPDQPDEREWRNSGHDWRAQKYQNGPPDYSERRTATTRWQRSILIIAALSALSWAALILVVIALVSLL
jgi:hypothetical protein